MGGYEALTKTPEGQALLGILPGFKTLDQMDEEEATWLIQGWIPSGQITLLAADGGVGKTSLWCSIIAALSSGTSCMLDPPGTVRQPMRILFITTEDSVRKKLKTKLRLAGANQANIITPDFMDGASGSLRALKFGTPQLEAAISQIKPDFAIFDPVQGMVPPDINMGNRNAMRDCMAPLIALGEKYGTTFLVVCHTNKRKGAYGRDRIADSADLWDISRSVLMAGMTEEDGVRYLSNEKNSYANQQKTALFRIDNNGNTQPEGSTWKRDKDFMVSAAMTKTPAVREDCEEFLIQTLTEAGGRMLSRFLEGQARDSLYTQATIKRAKDALKAAEKIRYEATGNRKNTQWYTVLTYGIDQTQIKEPPPSDILEVS